MVCFPAVSLLSFLLLMGVVASPVSQVLSPTDFAHPERIQVEGCDTDIMEPFLSRDGKYLFFNNLNEPRVDTNLFWAERVDDLHFKCHGELPGVNTAALDAVASLDRQQNFFFVSTRSYKQTASTIYQGRFEQGHVTEVHLVPQLSLGRPGIVNFDAEISADGQSLYFVESQFKLFGGGPKWAHILLAHRTATGFLRDPVSPSLLRTVNSEGLNYAPAASASECVLFFTRVIPGKLPAIYMAQRPNAAVAFNTAVAIPAITGFAEAPTLSPDERSLYYHVKENGRFVLYRVTRN